MEALLKDLDFIGLYKLFDLIFVISALISLAIILLNNKIKNMKYSRYLEDQDYDFKKK